jgi:hypothetical protein
MSPVGSGILSLTKFYRLLDLVSELARVAPGMTPGQVRDVLGGARKELADDLVLYDSGVVIDDPLLQACRSRSASALPLIWVALAMADTRLAGIVENYLTDGDGKLIADRFNRDGLQAELGRVLGEGRGTRKPATNILSYLRDSGLVEPLRRGGTTVGINQTRDTAPFVRDAVRYILFRLQHFEEPYPDDLDDAGVAIAVKANHWLNLTPDEFRAAFEGTPPDVISEAPPPPEPPTGEPPPIASEVEVEAHNTESYEVSGQTTRTAVRREQPLVLAYTAWMRNRGSEIKRLKFRPPNTPHHLLNDVYDKTRNNLVESKADASRPSIRMVIGQLMDYRRFAEGARLAVLTERRPPRDLEDLLGTLGIACIWRTQDRFVDNADGAFI